MDHEEAIRRFEELVSKYGHVIRAAVRSIAGAEADRFGDDVEQQVLLEVWKQIQREQIVHYPSSYLYRAAVRETIRQARRMRQRSEEELEPVIIEDPHPESHPERKLLSHELSGRLRRLASGLLEDRRTAVLAHLAGFRVGEIMESRNWSYNRTRNLIARGIADLRRALEQDDEN